MSLLFSLRDAAQQLGGVSIWTLRKHFARGNLRVVRVGRRVLVSSEEIERIRQEGLPSLGTKAATLICHSGDNSNSTVVEEVPCQGK
jgi:hypothetical protein